MIWGSQNSRDIGKPGVLGGPSMFGAGFGLRWFVAVSLGLLRHCIVSGCPLPLTLTCAPTLTLCPMCHPAPVLAGVVPKLPLPRGPPAQPGCAYRNGGTLGTG